MDLDQGSPAVALGRGRESVRSAAYTIGGGCSDDVFSDFRATLLSMGRGRFERIVAWPAALIDAELDVDNAFYEGYQYMPSDVYEAIIGKVMASD